MSKQGFPDQRIQELEQSITVNDEYLRKLQESHTELLRALKAWSTMASWSDDYWSNILNQTAIAIANADKLK